MSYELDLSALSALENAATPGPWERYDNDGYSINRIRSPDKLVAEIVGDDAETEVTAEFIAAIRNAAPALLRALSVANEIRAIMVTYREQEAAGFVDTPGGLEHMGDVWSQLHEWDEYLRADPRPTLQSGGAP